MIAQELRVSSNVKPGARGIDSERWVVRSARSRERGLWSFLTWSFFLSQILAAQQFIGSGAYAAENAADTTASGDGSLADAVTGPHSAPIIGDGPAADEPGVAEQSDAAPSGIAGDVLRLPPDANLQQELGLSLEPIDRASPTAASVPPELVTLAAAAPALQVAATGESPDLDVPGALDPILGPVLDGIVSPVLGTVGDLVGTLNPVLEPVLGTVGGVVDTLESVLDPVVSPVLATVGDLAGTLDPVLDQVAAPLLDTVGDLVSPLQPVIEPLAAPVLGSLAEVTSEIGPLPSLAGLGLESVAGASGAGDLLASGGSVVLQELPVISSIALDNLFVGGSYSDYNLELQSTSQNATTVSESAMDIDAAIQDDQTGIALDQSDAQTQSPIIALPSILDEIALRGLGDGIS